MKLRKRSNQRTGNQRGPGCAILALAALMATSCQSEASRLKARIDRQERQERQVSLPFDGFHLAAVRPTLDSTFLDALGSFQKRLDNPDISAEEVRSLAGSFEEKVAERTEKIAAIEKLTAFSQELANLQVRYQTPTDPAAKEFKTTLDGLQQKVTDMAKVSAGTGRSLTQQLDSLRLELSQKTKPTLPHVRERHTSIEQRVKFLLPIARARRDSADPESKKRDTLDRAIRLLEGLQQQLRSDDGNPYLDSLALDQFTQQIVDANRLLLQAEDSVDLRPSPWFRMHTGFATLSPYVVRSTTSSDPPSDPPGAAFTLDRASSSPSFYVEADFLHRRAWLAPRDRLAPSDSTLRFLMPQDHEIRVRFMDSDEIKDQKSAASGDWSAEGSLGWQLFDYEAADPTLRDQVVVEPRGSVTLEINAGINTDRASTDVHGFVQLGLGSSWSFPIEIKKGVFMPATFFSGVYYGIHEFPQLEQNDRAYTDRARPYYNELGALGIKIDVTYPLSESIEFVIGGRLAARLENDTPEDWSLFAGLSLPIGKLLGSGSGN